MSAESNHPSVNNLPLAQVDPEIAAVLEGELTRQRETLEMIASENFVPRAVLQAQGSVLTNKYAEGYPGKRYYGGCEQVDIAETLAITRAKSLFGADHANVQPHSGATANAAVLHALINPGDKILGLALAHGGHLTHGMKINFSGRLYQVGSYGVDPGTFLVDMDQVREIALEQRPDVIIGGWSAYPRHLDFAAFRAIADEVGAKLWVDMAHFAGLVAAGLHPSPVPFSDVVSSTVHKTIGGPRSGFILSREEYAKRIDSAVFPGQQGGPLMHVIAAKAVNLLECSQPEYQVYARAVIANAQQLATSLGEKGIRPITGGTDTHLSLHDLQGISVTGKDAEARADAAGIVLNKNAIPFDPQPPNTASGIRVGTPCVTTQGMGTEEMKVIAELIHQAVTQTDGDPDHPKAKEIRAEVSDLVGRFPAYPRESS